MVRNCMPWALCRPRDASAVGAPPQPTEDQHMVLEVTNVTDNPDSEHYVDIEHDGDILVSVDAHNGDPPTVSIFQPGEPEDALLSVQFDEDGEINSWRD